MGSGFARGAAARGKRIAFGDGHKIIWSRWAPEIYKNNPNVAQPGDESRSDLEWIAHYKGSRLYNTTDQTNKTRQQTWASGTRWRFTPGFRPIPGEIFFDEPELKFADSIPQGRVFMEPYTKRGADNKRWHFDRYCEVAARLMQAGYKVCQPRYSGSPVMMPGVEHIVTPGIRHALAALSRAKLFIGNEGALHHAAAALGVPAVVIFGGFIHPRTTGYDTHMNLHWGDEPCGSWKGCPHCRLSMHKIKIEDVFDAAVEVMSGGKVRNINLMDKRARLAEGSRIGNPRRPYVPLPA